MAIKRTRKIAIITTAVILLAVFVPQHFARAVSSCAPLPGVFDLINCSIEIVNIPLYLIAWLLGFVAGLLNDFITASSTIIIPAVRESWTILRDFVNMLFILVLIIAAFGTIFDIRKYTWREMLVPFLIAALLINFSFVIGEYVIGIGNGLSSIFLKQIGSTNLKDRIGQGLGMQKIIANPEGKDLTGTAFSAIGGAASSLQQLITIIFFIIFGAIALMAMIAAFIFVFIRIPILWFFLIVSPIAWFGYTLPNLRAETWSKWWHNFIRWVFFLPVYLFFLMFGFIFIAAKNNTAQLVQSATLGRGALIVVNDIAFYVVTLIFLAGGLVMSLKVGGMAGSGAAKLMGKVEGGVKKYMPGAGYVRAVGAGAREGLKAKGEEIKEKGVFGIGGAQAERLRQARFTELFGFGARRGEAERVKSAEIEKEVEKIKKLSLGRSEFESKKAGARGLELLAMRQMAAENGWIPRGVAGTKEIEDTIKTAGENSAFAQKYIKALGDNNFTDAFGSVKEMEDFARKTTILSLKKTTLETMAKNNDILSEDMAKMVLNVFSTDTKEKQDKIKESLQKNIKNFAETRTKKDRAAYLTDKSKDDGLRRLLAKQMSEDGEIDSYEKYHTAERLLGGATTAEARKVFDKLEKDDPITQAEILFRRTLVDSDPAYTLTPTEVSTLSDQYAEKIKKISEKQLAELPKERWSSPGFESALVQRANELKTKFPAYNIPAGAINPLTGKVAKKNIRIPSGAERFKSNLKKIVGADPDKGPVVDRLPT